MKLLLLIVLVVAAWVAAVVQWFQHDDHAALGLLGLAMVLGNYTGVEARKLVSNRGSWS
jgi:hypothetical protein